MPGKKTRSASAQHASILSNSMMMSNDDEPKAETTNVTKKALAPRRAKARTNSGANSFERALHDIVYKYMKIDLKQNELDFFKEFLTELPELNETWDRIGFNEESKESRLKLFYEKITEIYQEIIESECDLEEEIMQEIEKNKQKMKVLTLELHMNYTDPTLGKHLSKLDEETLVKEELSKLETEKNKRLEEFQKLAAIEKSFCERLNMKTTKLSVMPSEYELNQLRSRNKELKNECDERIKELTILKDTIDYYMQELDATLNDDSFIECLLIEDINTVSLSDEHMARTKRFFAELQTKDAQVQSDIKTLRTKIIDIWQKLHIENDDDEVRAVLVDKNSSCFQKDYGMNKKLVLQRLQDEYDRCVQIKMANMQKFIETTRADIRAICAKLYMSKADMKRLEEEMLSSTDFTEQLLSMHEAKLEDLRFSYDENQTLYEKTAKWIELWEEFLAFDEKTKDPARFKIRGYNMLEEEKRRKAFNTQLPKLEEEISRLSEAYEQENGGKEYCVYGLNIAEFVNRKKYDYEESKNNEKREKQILRDTIKKNESRYGSKPITPLALRNKRKAGGGGIQETHLQTPSRHSKLQRTELSTPGTSKLGTTRLGVSSVKPTTQGTRRALATTTATAARSKMTVGSKRKSRTPGKNRLRRSRMLAASKQKQQQQQQGDEDDSADVTMKTTTSVATTGSMLSSNMTTCSYQSSINSASSMQHHLVNGSTHSNASSNSYKLLMPKSSAPAYSSVLSSHNKHPPVCASSKYNVKHLAAPTAAGMTCMTSTASNTFIEEEGNEIENACIDENIETLKQTKTVLTAAAHKLSTTGTRNPGKFGFKFQEPILNESKIGICDVNYTEFTRDLTRSTRIGNIDTGSSHLQIETTTVSTHSGIGTRSKNSSSSSLSKRLR